MIKTDLNLRTILFADAATCAAMGTLLVAGAGAVERLTAIPADLALGAGLALFPIALVMAAIARPARPWRAGAALTIAGNWAWVAASLALPAGGWIAPNGLGLAFIVAQAAAVAVLALLEQAALRRPMPAVA